MRNTICLTARVTDVPSAKRTQHYVGLPPAVTGRKDDRHEMPSPSVLIIEERSDGIFLNRFAANGQAAGDTWHRSLDEAKEQAEMEFGGNISTWKEVPPEIDDPIPFALSQ
jgi:hypothetical protein